MSVLTELAQKLLDLDKQIEESLIDVDARNLPEVVKILRKREKCYMTIGLDLTFHSGTDRFDTEWTIYHGENFKAPTLAAAFAAWKKAKLDPEQLTVETIAGIIQPSLADELMAEAAK